MKKNFIFIFFSLFMLLFFVTDAVYVQAQIEEPEVLRTDRSRTPLTEGLLNGLGFNVLVNNFGFGIGGEYRRVIGPDMEAIAILRITGLRDASEQTFTDVFFGQQVIPNKFKRAFAFPFMLGLRHRLFARAVEDNFRFFVNGSFGPAAAFAYPYFDDRNNNGFRERFIDNFEPVNDIFSGLGQGDWHFGFAGELSVSIDFGANFANISTLRFGYFFYNFPSGIQMMQPN
ncbi:MAG: hypothetical protein ACFCU6_10280, partial [Balneolaceae bacterium]